MSYGVLPVLNRLSEYQRRDVQWLWRGRVPLGKVTLICGDPGVGKSMVTMDMAARVSSGLEWPGEGGTEGRGQLAVGNGEEGVGGVVSGQGAQAAQGTRVSEDSHPWHAEAEARRGSVLVLSGEDDPCDTIRPRVERAGGDAARVVIMRAVQEMTGGQFGVGLDTDIDAIGQALSRLDRPRLLIIDPISAFLGRVNSYNNAAVRSVLTRLGDIAVSYGIAVVCVTHINKTAGLQRMHRVMGSLAFAAAPRMLWRIAPLVDGRMGMVCVKSNMGNAGPIAFSVVDGRVVWSSAPVAVEVEEVEQGPSALEEACVFLREMLEGGPRRAGEVIAEARRAGISGATLKRARAVVGVVASHEGEGRGRPWVWGRVD